MGKKKILQVVLVIILLVINLLIFKFCNVGDSSQIKVSFEVESNTDDVFQIYYSDTTEWSEENSQRVEYNASKKRKLEFLIPIDSKTIRIDLGTNTSNLKLTNLEISKGLNKISGDVAQLLDTNTHNQIQNISTIENGYEVSINGNDPYIVYSLTDEAISSLDNQYNPWNIMIKIFACIVVDLVGVAIIFNISKITSLYTEIKSNKSLIWNLSKNDFKTKYAGSYLGIIWAFVQPIVTILVYWFVFEFGLKSGSPVPGVPFVVWFVSGLIPWFFFQEALMNATNCMAEYSYLVKKVVFKISILPVVKTISALFVHLVFIGFLLVVAAVYKFYPSIYTIQLIYYSFCTFCLALALSYGTCAMIVFFKDLGQLISIFLQIGMWMTPIMWSYTIIKPSLRWIVKLNPMYYIVEGYRDAFINHVWFWQRYYQTIFFWCVTLGIFIIGTIIFKKLKPHFADVL